MLHQGVTFLERYLCLKSTPSWNPLSQERAHKILQVRLLEILQQAVQLLQQDASRSNTEFTPVLAPFPASWPPPWSPPGPSRSARGPFPSWTSFLQSGDERDDPDDPAGGLLARQRPILCGLLFSHISHRHTGHHWKHASAAACAPKIEKTCNGWLIGICSTCTPRQPRTTAFSDSCTSFACQLSFAPHACSPCSTRARQPGSRWERPSQSHSSGAINGTSRITHRTQIPQPLYPHRAHLASVRLGLSTSQSMVLAEIPEKKRHHKLIPLDFMAFQESLLESVLRHARPGLALLSHSSVIDVICERAAKSL